MVILFPRASTSKDAPDNLLFGIKNIEQMLNGGGNVKYQYFTPCYKGTLKKLWLALRLTIKVITTKHDVLYYSTDPLPNLALLALLKKLHIYRKPMYAWKYIALHGGRLSKMLYDAFDCIFMVTERHVDESLNNGFLSKDRIRYIKWGEDTKFVDGIKPAGKRKEFTLISTGKAYRDFDTMCKAVDGLDGVRLKIFTTQGFGNCNYVETLKKYESMPNVEITFCNEWKGNTLPRLFSEMKAADCALVICKKVNFGIGYTAVLDAMACGLPIIATYHKDNPIDIDARKIGMTVEAENVFDLRQKIEYLVAHREDAQCMGKTARNLIETEYNIKLTAQEVLNVIEDKK